ncbi:MAG: magnesium transporter CorA, partial [Lachnospiraceae bacterium]|nr:magnesium transporter CorA [Lachnospiraceae bacterium]
MYYLIDTMLRSCSSEEYHRGEYQYVAVLSPEEWTGESAQFEMGIDLDLNVDQIYTTKAEVNYDSVTGTFDIPDRNSMTGDYHK